MQLICFPHAGGFSLYYSFLKEAKLSHVDRVLLFDYHRRPPGSADFGDYVEDAVHYVQQHASDEPCLLFGHSMGALVACECGFVLQNRLHRPPVGVIVSGQNPLCYYQGKHWEYPADVDAYLERLGGIPDFISENPEAYRFFKQTIQTDMQVLETYRPTVPPPEQRLVLGLNLYGSEDIVVDSAVVPLWSKTFARVHGTRVFSGNHFYLEDHRQELLAEIDAFAEQAERNAEGHVD